MENRDLTDRPDMPVPMGNWNGDYSKQRLGCLPSSGALSWSQPNVLFSRTADSALSWLGLSFQEVPQQVHTAPVRDTAGTSLPQSS